MPVLGSVLLRIDGPVGYLGLDRPETLNAFDVEMIEDITVAAKWLSAQEEVKAVIVHSTGRAFSSGFHLRQFSESTPGQAARNVEAGRRMIETVSAMRPITIAAAAGHCVGGGFVLIAACDFRYAADDLSVYLPEARLGIPLAWGGVPRLVREIGPAATAELILLCDRVGSGTLKELGVLNGIVPAGSLLAHAESIAQRLADLSPMVLETTKLQIALASKALASTEASVMEENVVFTAMSDEASAKRRSDYLKTLG
ncbi:MAG: enoyl-CoA hydratase/isomerase family protein [Paracoccaceae bacterium]